jgi:hypothetical protein
MNAPERSSAFILDEDSGEQKVTYNQDTKVQIRISYVLHTFVAVVSSFQLGVSHLMVPEFCVFLDHQRGNLSI